MSFELAEMILVVVVVFSQIAMINHATARDKEKGEETSILYNPLRMVDYIKITTAAKGRIGLWFWTFLTAIILLIVVVIVEIITG